MRTFNFPSSFSQTSNRQQRGLAAILLVLLVGLSLSAAVLGTMYYIRSEQDSMVTAHGATQAQMKAWNGVEAFRQYLYQIGLTGTTSLAAGNAITLGGVTGVAGSVVSLNSTTGNGCVSSAASGSTQGTLVTANFTGSSGGATSTVQAVYCVTGSTTSSSPGNTNAINFNHDVNLGGSITINSSTTTAQNAVINVQGAFNAGSLSLTGLKAINATGNVTLGSNSSVNVISSNGNVTLSGSASALTINAMGNVVLTGAAYAGAINANGTVSAQSTNNGAIVAIGDVTLGGATSVKTKGSVTMDYSTVGTLYAQKNLTVTSSGSVGSGIIGGALSKPSWNNNVNVTQQTGYTVAITPLTALTLTTQTVDAYQLQSLANYVFDVDSSGYRKVTVANVNGIANGTYYLGNYDGSHQDYLCTALATGSSASNPTCLTPAVGSAVTICQGYSASNSCFAYSTSNSTWSINGTSIAQGVTWFHGNLALGNGNYYNTFIATGNIATSGSFQVYAPSYAGYNGSVSGTNYTPTGICVNSFFPARYPTNLCTPTSNPTSYVYTANPAANYALLAGGAVNGIYSGGNISLGSSNTIYGSVLAGNQLTTGGSTVVNGYVTAAGNGSSVTNSLGGSTTINLTALPPAYQPGAGLPSTGGGASTSTNNVQVFWSRYL